jgi:hypothetical protein
LVTFFKHNTNTINQHESNQKSSLFSFLEQEDSFCSGYNSCLVEISGSLMTATDLDFKTKSYLLTFISKLSTTRHTAPARKLSEDNNNNCSGRNPRKRLSDSHLYQSPRRRVERQEFLDQPVTFEAQYIPDSTQKSRRSPLLNIQNMNSGQTEELVNLSKAPNQNENRGVKRSRTESYEKENIKRSKTDSIRQKNSDHSTKHILQSSHKTGEEHRNSHPRPSVLVPTTTIETNPETTSKTVQFQTTPVEKLDFQFQSSAIKTLPKNCSINTNIAVIQQNADGKFTKISNIPLKALIGNLDVFKQSDIISNVELRKKQNIKHKQENQPINITNQNPSSQYNQQPNTFSYMKLLQEETFDHELLKTNHTQQQLSHEIAPLNTKGKTVSLPSLNAFLRE